jgi:hypothetical protein
MLKTLIISTPDGSRNNWKAIRAKLASAGLEIWRYHSRLTAEGMTIVADVMGGDVPALDGARIYQMPWKAA